eukprot:SAG31_NODE_1408_length_8473_cov_2.276809_3_plen_225_part_00
MMMYYGYAHACRSSSLVTSAPFRAASAKNRYGLRPLFCWAGKRRDRWRQRARSWVAADSQQGAVRAGSLPKRASSHSFCQACVGGAGRRHESVAAAQPHMQARGARGAVRTAVEVAATGRQRQSRASHFQLEPSQLAPVVSSWRLTRMKVPGAGDAVLEREGARFGCSAICGFCRAVGWQQPCQRGGFDSARSEASRIDTDRRRAAPARARALRSESGSPACCV